MKIKHKFKAMKFETFSDEHTKAIQTELFRLGYKWRYTKYQDHRHLNSRHLFTCNNGSFDSCLCDLNHYNGFNGEIITLMQLQKIASFELKVNSLEDKLEFNNTRLTVGCQSISFNDMIKIKDFLIKCIESKE
jgi:hypothetical protein